MNHIELFAGCGGLNLGLERAGFKLLLANELSAMAAETFTYNILKEDLTDPKSSNSTSRKALWISSAYPDLKSRLRENPFKYPQLGGGYSDLDYKCHDLKGKLLIGSINQLNELLATDNRLLIDLKSGFGDGTVDLVSGGPPCQSFSLAGLRKMDSDKNRLPWEFAKFVEHVRPKFAVLENVSGILRGFKVGNTQFHAWFEVAKAFAGKGYLPLCLLVNARHSGVPQNRPRFIMICIRYDIYKSLTKTFNREETELFRPTVNLYEKINNGNKSSIAEYKYFDSVKPADMKYFEHTFLREFCGQKEISVEEAIDDLRLNNPSRKSKFITDLNKHFSTLIKVVRKTHNHEPRNNNPLVKRRFRIYQIIQKCDKSVEKQVLSILKGESFELDQHAWVTLKEYKFLIGDSTYRKFQSKKLLTEFLMQHPTKKQTQKALIADAPAPAALSIPDDACHYHEHELRTLTVREMARIQSFPDGFEFRSKITTGGQMRKFEVPQYTQVGNAVPPMLGYRIGLVISELKSRI